MTFQIPRHYNILNHEIHMKSLKINFYNNHSYNYHNLTNCIPTWLKKKLKLFQLIDNWYYSSYNFIFVSYTIIFLFMTIVYMFLNCSKKFKKDAPQAVVTVFHYHPGSSFIKNPAL